MKEILQILFILSGIPTILLMVAWIMRWITCNPIVCFLPFVLIPLLIVAAIGSLVTYAALMDWRNV